MRLRDLTEDTNLPARVFHGTSMKRFEELRRSGFEARDLYVGEDRANIVDHYAEKAAMEDDSDSVVIEFDPSKFPQINDDYHTFFDGDEQQLGQYIVSGKVGPAIIRVLVTDEDGDEREITP